MTFNRYSDECVVCACYFENCEGEVRELMDEAGIECSLENEMFSDKPCRYFQWAD